MSNYEFISNYRENDLFRQYFNNLALDVFGIDFSEFYNRGLWQNEYKCYSYIDKNKMIANVSINLFPLIVNGKFYKALQIGTVMTLNEYRNKGLSRKLMEKVFKDYKDKIDIFYLFANSSVRDFYPKFGFKKVQQFLFEFYIYNKSTCFELEKIDIDNLNHYKIIKRIVENRVINSSQYDAEKCAYLNLFHLNFVYNNNIFYSKEYDALLIYKQNADSVDLYDFISTEKTNINEVCNNVFSSEVKKVILHFTPDLDCKEFKKIKYDDSEDLFFVKSDVKIPEIFHPALAKA
ncbi:MAG: GNAT family N-acetyltransferase [Candidatus Muiribacteriota bacterium]